MAEGGGLLNRYRGNTPIVGSNPIPSATLPPCESHGFGAEKAAYGTRECPISMPQRKGVPHRRESAPMLAASEWNVVRHGLVTMRAVRARPAAMR